MKIKFEKGIGLDGKNFLKVQPENEESFTDISSIPIENFINEKLGVTIPDGYLFKKEVLISFGDQQKRFEFSKEINLQEQSTEEIAESMQERIDIVKTWMASLPSSINWEVEI